MRAHPSTGTGAFHGTMRRGSGTGTTAPAAAPARREQAGLVTLFASAPEEREARALEDPPRREEPVRSELERGIRWIGQHGRLVDDHGTWPNGAIMAGVRALTTPALPTQIPPGAQRQGQHAAKALTH